MPYRLRLKYPPNSKKDSPTRRLAGAYGGFCDLVHILSSLFVAECPLRISSYGARNGLSQSASITAVEVQKEGKRIESNEI
jgi:hypothetical protein